MYIWYTYCTRINASSRTLSLFLAPRVTGECPKPCDKFQHLHDVLITTCHLNWALIPSPLSENAGSVWNAADIYKSGRRLGDSWWHSPFSGPRSCWTSFRQRRHFWTSCRRPCSWWWAGGRRSAVVPSSLLTLSGWVAGSSCPRGHCCKLKYQKKKHGRDWR